MREHPATKLKSWGWGWVGGGRRLTPCRISTSHQGCRWWEVLVDVVGACVLGYRLVRGPGAERLRSGGGGSGGGGSLGTGVRSQSIFSPERETPWLPPPYSETLVLSSTDHSLSVWTPVHRKHLVGVSGQVYAQLARLDVPDLQRAVAAPAHQQAAVG